VRSHSALRNTRFSVLKAGPIPSLNPGLAEVDGTGSTKFVKSIKGLAVCVTLNTRSSLRESPIFVRNMILVTRPWRPPWTLCFSTMMSSRNLARQRRRSRKISRMPRLQRGHHLTDFYWAAFSCRVHPRTRTRPLEQDRSGAPTIRFLYEQFEDFVEKPWLAIVESFALGGGCQMLCVMDRVIA
jgi:hypothetical protein